MKRQRELLIAAAAIMLMIAAEGCRKPAEDAAASDAAASAEPASAPPTYNGPVSDLAPPESEGRSSAQVADNGRSAQGGNCYTTTIGGGYTPGVNGGPGIITPGQQTTICSAPVPHNPVAPRAAVPVAAAAPAAAAAAPAASAAQPSSAD